LREHLTRDELRALVLPGGTVSPEAGAHFARCVVCQVRLADEEPETGRQLLDQLRPVLRRVERLSVEALCDEMRRAADMIDLAVALASETLEGRGKGALLSELSPVAAGVGFIQVCPPYRLRNPRGLQDLALRLVEPLRNVIPEGEVLASEVLAQVEAELANSFRILGTHRSGLPFLRAALNRAREGTAAVRARVRYLGALFFRDVRDFESADILARSSEAAYREIYDQAGVEASQLLRAVSLFMQGRLSEARGEAERLIAQGPVDQVTEAGATQLAARVLTLEGNCWAAASLLPKIRRVIDS